MTVWMRALREAALDAVALVAPVDCAGCSAPDRALCDACRAHLTPSPRSAVLSAPGAPPLPVVAGLAYEGVARAALLALKQEGRTELARALAPALLAAADRGWAAFGRVDTLLVPVPGSPEAARQRGFHPAALLARRAGLAPRRLLRLAESGGGPQKGRALADRLAADRRITARARLDGRAVVVLDDVVTSGATLLAAADALRAAGAEVRGAVALAATPRRRGAGAVAWTVEAVDADAPGVARALRPPSGC
ncbi:phosphoribosyltransferase family protein [Microcella daejeonensis]|uniref:Phosphoribosyltransferase family protein n=1 Tax=Microcella daejeonensis TaxID=2994971 RepID=A0A9E8MLI6_9MICO|nr:phosphoribosyltransferase family protein [Microcella daejeonensis]WAB81834.1 phosphoribosyltransferase family protein [Microcella daejeonensis]